MTVTTTFTGLSRPAMAILATTVVSACTSLPALYVASYDGEIPEQWRTAHQQSPLNDTWWHHFEDARLSALIDEALLENPGIRQADAQTAQSLEQAKIAGAERLPQLNAALNSSRQRQSLSGFSNTAMPGSPANIISESHGASLNVSWEIDLWGRIGAQSEAARQDFLASEQNLRAVQQSIAAQTAKAYFAVIEAQEQVDLSERTVAAFEETARQIANRADAGVVTPTDKLLSISNLETARAGLHQRRDTYQRVVRQLETILRDYPDGAIETRRVLPDLPQMPAAGVPADLLARRPDLLAAERTIRALQLREFSSRRALLPAIPLTGSGGSQSNEFSDLLEGDFSVWAIAGQLVQPIFQGGRLRANVALAEARQREAVEAYAEVALNAFSEVEAALAGDALLAAREVSLVRAADAAAEAQRIAINRYEQGVILFITVLESQQRALETRSALIAARRARIDNRIDLHLALGGGFEQYPRTSGISNDQ